MKRDYHRKICRKYKIRTIIKEEAIKPTQFPKKKEKSRIDFT